MTAKLLAHTTASLVSCVSLPLVRSDPDLVRGVALEVSAVCRPETLLYIDMERLERADHTGMSNPSRSLLALIKEARTLAASGPVAVILDVDDLVVPGVDLSTQVWSRWRRDGPSHTSNDCFSTFAYRDYVSSCVVPLETNDLVTR